MFLDSFNIQAFFDFINYPKQSSCIHLVKGEGQCSIQFMFINLLSSLSPGSVWLMFNWKDRDVSNQLESHGDCHK